MAFSIKQLLSSIAVVAFGLVALLSEYKPVLAKLFDLLTLGILIAVAYGVWLSTGERRAFRIGFLCWALLYFVLYKQTSATGIYELMNRAYRAVTQAFIVYPPGYSGSRYGGYGGGGIQFPYSNFIPVSHSLIFCCLVSSAAG